MGKIILNGTGYAGSGGSSGGHTIVDPTGTDMPQENKLQFTGAVNVSDDSVNGQTVVNVEGGGNYYLNTIYSTEEKKVGYWTDNRPLYQKTCIFNPPFSAGNNTFNLNLSSECVIKDYAFFTHDNVSSPITIGQGDELKMINIGYNSGVNRAVVWIASGTLPYLSNGQLWITVQYTKTTDTPELNPQTGGVIYLPTIYSTEEREIGVWTDGKPLYQKTLVFTGTYSGASGSVPINISDLDTVFCANAWGIISTNAICTLPYVHSSTNNNGGFFISADKTTIGIRFASGLTLTKLVFTLQYTKTTDVAGSGSWTPSGANAVHYSTNEQVIGTWIDGKPIYQRTWTGTKNNGQDEVVISDLLNVDVLVDSRVTFIGNTGSQIVQYYRDANDRARVWLEGGDLKIHMDSGNNYPILPITWYITLQYTKTTD